jgi:hypothetical protein
MGDEIELDDDDVKAPWGVDLHPDVVCYGLNDGITVWDHPSHGPFLEHPDGTLEPVVFIDQGNGTATLHRRLN